MSRRPGREEAGAPEGSKAAYALSALFWVVLWAVAASVVGNSLLLAGPAETLQAFVRVVPTAGFWEAVGSTGARILLVGAASAVAGAVLGFAAARWRPLRVLLAPPVQVMKSVPVACLVVVVLVLAGSSGALIAIVVCVALPPFYVAALEGWQARPRLTERVLRRAGVGSLPVFLGCTWPALLPFLTAATKTAVGLSWKAGITAELLCVPLGSMGAAIYASKLTLDVPALLMWTVVVMALGWASERVLLFLLGLTADSPRWAVRIAAARSFASDLEPAAVEIRGAAFAFGARPVLDEVSLRVAAGERMCLMAPTGSGKTTLVSLLTGERTPFAGAVSTPPLLGIVAQDCTLVGTLSALDNVRLACGRRVDDDRLEAELGSLLPEGTLHRRASELSGGTRRLVEIARALYGPGGALVMDEPFAGLDEQANARACAFILAYQEARPLLVATHRREDANRLEASVVALEEL